MACSYGLIFWAGAPQGTMSYGTTRWSFFRFLHYLRFCFRSVPPKPCQLPLRPFQLPFWSCQLSQLPLKPFQIPLRAFQLPLRPFQPPLRPSELPLGPSELHLKPSKLPEALPAVSETRCLKCPLHSINCIWGSLQLNLRPLLCPLSLFCSAHCSLFCFPSLFPCHTVLKTCVCFNTTSKRIELESHTTSQIKDNFEGYPKI